MDVITKDKQLVFVIEHYRDIRAIIDLYDSAKGRLPKVVNMKIVNIILDLNKSYFPDNNLVCLRENDGISWYDPTVYDDEEETGIFFNYADFEGWEALTSDDHNDKPWITLTLFPPKARQRETRKRWLDIFRSHKLTLTKNDIVVQPDEQDPNILAAYYLDKEINMDVLKNPEILYTSIQQCVINFTDTIRPILKED